ncbi:MAG: Universal stress protein UspA and related nucleotide-binding proteins, partial [uncultured Blastococcus sp.]
ERDGERLPHCRRRHRRVGLLAAGGGPRRRTGRRVRGDTRHRLRLPAHRGRRPRARPGAGRAARRGVPGRRIPPRRGDRAHGARARLLGRGQGREDRRRAGLAGRGAAGRRPPGGRRPARRRQPRSGRHQGSPARLRAGGRHPPFGVRRPRRAHHRL